MTIYERGAKLRRINTLMSACRLIPNRADILALWSVQCYDEMSDDEICDPQCYMERAYVAKTTVAPEAIRRLRSQVLSIMTKIGVYASPEDWVKVNAMLLKRRICGKLLYMLDADELRALVRKLRAINDKKPIITSRPTTQVAPILLFTSPTSEVVN